MHQIRREKRTIISEVFVRGKPTIKFSFESSSFILPQFKYKLLFFFQKRNHALNLLTLLACTIGILSTLTYAEFYCAALLAML